MAMLPRGSTTLGSTTRCDCPNSRQHRLICHSNTRVLSIGSTFPMVSFQRGECTLVFAPPTIILFRLPLRFPSGPTSKRIRPLASYQPNPCSPGASHVPRGLSGPESGDYASGAAPHFYAPSLSQPCGTTGGAGSL